MACTYENEGEYKGFGKRNKYKPRIFKVTEGIFECYEKKKCRISINLLKEPWTDLKEVGGEGKKCKSCWEFQYGGKTYNFASPDDNERASVMKELKTFYDKQAAMNNSIESSGKYNRDKPNNDDFKEVQSIFEQSTSSEFDNAKKNARGKASAQTWKVLKKDPYWKIEIYLLKEKHGISTGSSGAAAAPVDDEKKDDAPAEEAKEEEPKKEEKKKGGMFGKFKAKAAAAAADATAKAKAVADSAKEKAKEAAAAKLDKKDEDETKDYGYSGKKPNDDVYQDLTEVFEKSTHGDFKTWDEKKRRKELAQYWKKLKKDKQWIKTMNELRNKHEGFISETGPTVSYVDDTKDDADPYTDLGDNANPFSLVDADEKKEEDDRPNQNPLKPVTLEDLRKENIGTFTSQLAAEALKIKYDLIASNEYCQIAIGMGLVKGEDEEEEEQDDDTPAGWAKKRDPDGKTFYQNITSGQISWDKPSSDEYKINKRPKFDDDDLVPNVTHDGTIGKSIQFTPEDRDFTIAMEIKCGNINAGNTLFSDGKFEYVAPRPGSKRVAVRLIQKGKKDTELQNIGETELSQNVWYHIVIVCYRANDEDKRPKTDFKVFLNGVSDGEISIKKKSEGGIMSSIGGLFGKKKKAVVYTPTIGASPIDGEKFYGGLKNVKIFYKALEHKDVKQLAYTKENIAYMQPSMISYDKNSLTVTVPQCDMRYHGPDMLRLPAPFQTFKPSFDQSFTICAWIYCNRIGAANGSVILTNINNTEYDNTGFEFVCPTNKAHVIGLRCSNSSDIIPIGTREIKINKYYHIAITVDRVMTRGDEPDQTDIAVYVNGKNDGTYNFKSCKDYFDDKPGAFWTVGHNTKNEQGTRFDGSIADLRIFTNKCLPEPEIACVYASCLKERKFKSGNTVYYLQKNKITCPKCNTVYDDWSTSFCGQCGSDLIVDNDDDNDKSDVDLTSRQTFLPNATWRKAEFQSINMSECSGTVQDLNNSERRTVPINEIIPADPELLKYESFIPGIESQKISNLGGWIQGKDFEGRQWKIYSTNKAFLKYICRPSSMSLLCCNLPYQKHEMEELIKNQNIDNKYILNRLLYSAHELLKNINLFHGEGSKYNGKELTKLENDTLTKKEHKNHHDDVKKVWKYFNEFILPWEIWAGDETKINVFGGVNDKGESLNFKEIQIVAKALQEKYKHMQLNVFENLLSENKNWEIFNLKNFDDSKGTDENPATGIENRQNDQNIPNAIGTECDEKLWDMEDTDYEQNGVVMTEFQIYDKKVSTMLLWGRCFVLQDPFQAYFKKLYGNPPPRGNSKFDFVAGPIKTYERMMEKAIEYRVEDKKPHPSSYSICDINRCSIKCQTLDDVLEAFGKLKQCPDDEVKIARIKNRFLPEFDATHPQFGTGGYRDMLVNVIFVDKFTGLAAIGEIQFHLIAYEYIKHLQHKYYKIVRAVDYKSLLRNYEAGKFKEKGAKKQKTLINYVYGGKEYNQELYTKLNYDDKIYKD